MHAELSWKTWTAYTLLWIALVVAYTFATWPRVPMGVNAADPVIANALQAAARAHLGLAALWSILLPAMAVLLARILGRKRETE